MANQRLIHDAAFATSLDILALFAGCLREDEQRAAFEEIFKRVKAGMELYELRSDRMASRLRPGRN